MKNRVFGILPLLFALLIMMALVGCSQLVQGGHPAAAEGGSQPFQSSSRIHVVASFYPIAFFASQVGGDRVTVTSLVPAGVEPHDWEPSVADVKALNAAQVFAYNGADFEPWVGKTLESLGNHQLIAVNASEGLDLIRESNGDAPNPHVWLDPVSAAFQVDRIEAALAQADPEGKQTYEANGSAFKAKLAELDRQYQALGALGQKDVVVSHAFFSYPARRYGLHEVAVSVSPDSEPTPRQVADVATYVKDHHIKYLFAETLVNDKVMQTIAEQTGAKILTLNPVEGLTEQDLKEGKDYLSILRANLASLRQGLQAGE
ncbi:MAG: metal ABC transporter solute-binding protein, Zn/Mn family [Symbiobacteriia bacterium]